MLSGGEVRGKVAKSIRSDNGATMKVVHSTKERLATMELLQPTLQALAVLSNVSVKLYLCMVQYKHVNLFGRFWLISLTVCLEAQRRTKLPLFSRQCCSTSGLIYTITSKPLPGYNSKKGAV